MKVEIELPPGEFKEGEYYIAILEGVKHIVEYSARNKGFFVMGQGGTFSKEDFTAIGKELYINWSCE